MQDEHSSTPYKFENPVRKRGVFEFMHKYATIMVQFLHAGGM